MRFGVIILFAIAVITAAGFFLSESNKQSQSQIQPEEEAQTQSEPTHTDIALSNPLTFTGTLPCADCPGIDTTLTLNPDNAYTLSEVYQGKNDDEPFVTNGTWEEETGTPTDPNATVYALRSDNGDVSYYLANGETITPLGQDKNTIDSPFDMTLTIQE